MTKSVDGAARLAALLGMMSSAHDGEALNAARLADQMLKKSGKTWADVLGKPAAASSPPQPPPPPPHPQPPARRTNWSGLPEAVGSFVVGVAILVGIVGYHSYMHPQPATAVPTAPAATVQATAAAVLPPCGMAKRINGMGTLPNPCRTPVASYLPMAREMYAPFANMMNGNDAHDIGKLMQLQTTFNEDKAEQKAKAEAELKTKAAAVADADNLRIVCGMAITGNAEAIDALKTEGRFVGGKCPIKTAAATTDDVMASHVRPDAIKQADAVRAPTARH